MITAVLDDSAQATGSLDDRVNIPEQKSAIPTTKLLTTSLPQGYHIDLAVALILAEHVKNHQKDPKFNQSDYLERINVLLGSVEHFNNNALSPDVIITGPSHRARAYILEQLLGRISLDKIESGDKATLNQIKQVGELLQRTSGYSLSRSTPLTVYGTIRKYVREQLPKGAETFEEEKREYYAKAAQTLVKLEKFSLSIEMFKYLQDYISIESVAYRLTERKPQLAEKIVLDMAQSLATSDKVERLKALQDGIKEDIDSGIKIVNDDRVPKMYSLAAGILFANGLYDAAAIAYAKAENTSGILAVFCHYVNEGKNNEALSILNKYCKSIMANDETKTIITTLAHLIEDDHKYNLGIEMKRALGLPYQLRFNFDTGGPITATTVEEPGKLITVMCDGSIGPLTGAIRIIRDDALLAANNRCN